MADGRDKSGPYALMAPTSYYQEGRNMSVTKGSAGGVASERMLRVNPLRRLLVRPETGAVAGSIAVWIYFAIVAGSSNFVSSRGASSYLSVSAELAILAVPVALLMIGGNLTCRLVRRLARPV